MNNSILNITNITNKNEIFFNTNIRLENVNLVIKDKKHEGVIFKTFFNVMEPKINYFITISSFVTPHLRNPYIELIGLDCVIPFNFTSTDLKNYSLIGNSCLCWRTYEKFNVPYNSPTISGGIWDDLEYLRFCEHIETYLDAPVILKNTKGNEKFREITGFRRLDEIDNKFTKNYAITHHYDIEIHWPHGEERFLTFNDGNYEENFGDVIPHSEFVDKWIRRAERAKKTEKICLWSSSEFFNIHGTWRRKQIVERFKNLPNRSVLLTELKEEEYEDELHIVKYIPEWEGRHQMERDKVGGTLWNDQSKNAQIMYDIIKQKFL